MKKKFVLVPLVALLVVLLLSAPCDKSLTCSGDLMNILAYPGQWFVLLIPLSLFAWVLDNQKYKFWLKFTGIFFLVSMVFVTISPETARGLMLNPDKEIVNWFFLGIYTITSIIYFIVQFVKSRR